MSIKAIIVDDERLARLRLNRLLAEQGVNVVAEGVDGEQAISLISQHTVDMLFIDINMPNKNGLDAATQIIESTPQPPSIIFCTAYDEYALQAFKANASAYLLKPINTEDLTKVITQAQQISQLQLNTIKHSLKKIQNQNSNLSLAIGLDNEIENIPLDEIMYFTSIDKNVFAIIRGRGEVLTNQTLKSLQEKFAENVIRIHRNTLVNSNQLSKLTRDESGQSYLHLVDSEEQLAISRRHLSEVKGCFS